MLKTNISNSCFLFASAAQSQKRGRQFLLSLTILASLGCLGLIRPSPALAQIPGITGGAGAGLEGLAGLAGIGGLGGLGGIGAGGGLGGVNINSPTAIVANDPVQPNNNAGQQTFSMVPLKPSAKFQTL